MRCPALFAACLLGAQLAAAQTLYNYQNAATNLVTYTTTSDLVYGVGAVSGGDSLKELHIDAYVPNGLDGYRKAAVLYIHGGGYTAGNKTQERSNAQYMAQRGFVAFSMQYRLQGDSVPVSGFSGIMRTAAVDAKAALRWIYANAAGYNIDTGHIFIGGTSAGAVSALLAGVTNDNEYVTDQNGQTVLAQNHPGQPMDVKGIISFCGALMGQTNALDAADPPILFYHGTLDSTVDYAQAVATRDRAVAVGLYNEFYPIEGGGHCPSQPAANGKNLRQLSFEFFLRFIYPSAGVGRERAAGPMKAAMRRGFLELELAGVPPGREVRVELFSSSGKRAHADARAWPAEGNARIPLPASLPSGLYFLRVRAGDWKVLRTFAF